MTQSPYSKYSEGARPGAIHFSAKLDQIDTEVTDLDEAGRSLEGVLAFQVHVGAPMTVQFKNIRIKHLPDEMPLTD